MRSTKPSLAEARAAFGDELVIKPLVSASAYGTHRLSAARYRFRTTVRGWRMLAQPWLKSITDSGEWSLIYFDGRFSHAVAKLLRARASSASSPSMAGSSPAATRRREPAKSPMPRLPRRRHRRPTPGSTWCAAMTAPASHRARADRAGFMARPCTRSAACFSQRFAQPPSARANSHWRSAEVRLGGRLGLEPRSVDLRDQRVDRHRLVARRDLERVPEQRLEADRRGMAGDQDRALDGRSVTDRFGDGLAQYMCCPPLIDSVDPVMKPPSSSTRNATPRAISSALPRRLTGILATILASTSGGTAATMSVSM